MEVHDGVVQCFLSCFEISCVYASHAHVLLFYTVYFQICNVLVVSTMTLVKECVRHVPVCVHEDALDPTHSWAMEDVTDATP